MCGRANRKERHAMGKLLAALAFAILAALPRPVVHAGEWLPLAKDGIHDPKSPALNLLQEPREALSRLPAGTAGNQVNWLEALEKGLINPRTNLLPGTEIRILDSDVLLNLRGGTPIVRFPHRQHTLWLDCGSCHEGLFKSQAGATKLSKIQILQGEQCGVCHGAVAFPLTECHRCHSVPRSGPAK
jgi:c(7)-type cytochrome triheme protein